MANTTKIQLGNVHIQIKGAWGIDGVRFRISGPVAEMREDWQATVRRDENGEAWCDVTAYRGKYGQPAMREVCDRPCGDPA